MLTYIRIVNPFPQQTLFEKGAMSLLKPRAAPARALGRVVTQPPPRAHNTLSSCRVLVQFVDAGHDDDRVDLCEWRVRVRVKVRVRARVRVRVRVRVSKGIDQIFGVVAADGCVDEGAGEGV